MKAFSLYTLHATHSYNVHNNFLWEHKIYESNYQRNGINIHCYTQFIEE